MKLISAAFCLAAICAVGVGAQSSETKSKTKVKVYGGREVTVVVETRQHVQHDELFQGHLANR